MTMVVAASPAPVKKFASPGLIFVKGRITPSSTYPTNGDPLNIAQSVGLRDEVPLLVIVRGKLGGAIYHYDEDNKKVIVMTNSAGGANLGLTEHTAAAYAVAVTNDVISFLAIFEKKL